MSKFSLNNLSGALKNSIGEGNISPSILAALDLAFNAHEGQFRETYKAGDPKIPYITHPVGVAINAFEHWKLVNLEDSIEDVLCASLLHDVIEDSEYGGSEISTITNHKVAELVQILTKPIIKEGLSREERNRLANEKIIEGGNTSMYIKICDHMHNIGRPTNTPSKLLQKAVDKGYHLYAGYFQKGKLSPELKSIYFEKLNSANIHLAKQSDTLVSGKSYTLEEAIIYCENRTKGKILELHDVADIIKVSTTALFSRLSEIETLKEMSISLPTGDKGVWISKLNSDIESGWIDISRYPKKVAKAWNLGCDYLYVNQLASLDLGTEVIFMSGYNQSTINWKNRSTVDFLFNSLLSRLKIQTEKRKKDFTEEVARLSLTTDISQLLKHNLRYKDLVNIKAWIDNANISMQSLQHLVKFLVEKDSIDLPYVTSRLKAISSILDKKDRRKLDSVYSIDDLIGLRVVCLSQKEVEITVTNLEKAIREKYDISKQEFKVSRISTSVGYVAVHIYFELGTHSNHSQIPCEIQVKTLFQDSWAKAYRVVAYDKVGTQKRLKGLFKELSETCINSDVIISEIDD